MVTCYEDGLWAVIYNHNNMPPLGPNPVVGYTFGDGDIYDTWRSQGPHKVFTFNKNIADHFLYGIANHIFVAFDVNDMISALYFGADGQAVVNDLLHRCQTKQEEKQKMEDQPYVISVLNFQAASLKDDVGQDAIILSLADDDETWHFGFAGSAAPIRLAENLLRLSLVQTSARDSRLVLQAIRKLADDRLREF